MTYFNRDSNRLKSYKNIQVNRMKKAGFIIMIMFILMSCGSGPSGDLQTSRDGKKVEVITFDDFRLHGDRYVGTFVKITGMCVRVGQNNLSDLFLVGDDPSYEIRVAAGDGVLKFSRFFEGRTLEIYGYVRDANVRKTFSGPAYYIDCHGYNRVEGK